jgi:hypothetical protein
MIIADKAHAAREPKSPLILASLAIALVAGCGAETPEQGERNQNLESCFSTPLGLQCIPTPAGPVTEPTDVDGDGQLDEFVCADGEDGAALAGAALTGEPKPSRFDRFHKDGCRCWRCDNDKGDDKGDDDGVDEDADGVIDSIDCDGGAPDA